MKIETSDLTNIAVRTSQYPTDKKDEFLLVGKSNVGKSSFINTILCRKNFARTSSKPGKTQTLNFYLCNDSFYIVDVPGYGYANVSKATQKKFGLMIEEYITDRENLRLVFMLIDFRHKPGENDILMYNYLKYYNIPVCIIATKYDKVKSSIRDKQERIVRETLEIKESDTLVLFSSVTKKGREEVYRTIESKLTNN